MLPLLALALLILAVVQSQKQPAVQIFHLIDNALWGEIDGTGLQGRNSSTLHSIPLHCIPFHPIPLHSTPLHFTSHLFASRVSAGEFECGKIKCNLFTTDAGTITSNILENVRDKLHSYQKKNEHAAGDAFTLGLYRFC